MYVVATAGHVDHGKSTLVRALTGQEPDRLTEEHNRGLSIELGYVWTELPVGEVAFVDVPGHERFVTTMLAGVGPVPVAMLVVAADDPWMPQAAEHLAAIDALGISAGLLVVTRCDLADPGPALQQARAALTGTSLRGIPDVCVSAATGLGLGELRQRLEAVLAEVPNPDPKADVRLWVDRVFTLPGAGTIVTGTLPAGTITVGETLQLDGDMVRVRGMESLGKPVHRASGAARVALRLGSSAPVGLRRGVALVAPDAWRPTTMLDVGVLADGPLPQEVTLHVGSASVPCTVRSLGAGTRYRRLALARPLPLRIGDRCLMRDPGSRRLWGATVLDPAPPALSRRGAAAARVAALTTSIGVPDLDDELRRRGVARRTLLRQIGVPPGQLATRQPGEWLLDPSRREELSEQLLQAVTQHTTVAPLDAGLTFAAAAHALELPDPALVEALVRPPLTVSEGRLRLEDHALPSTVRDGLDQLRRRLACRPFAAPSTDDLDRMGLDSHALAVAARAGSVLRLDRQVALLPGADREAVHRLRSLPQPFTASQARQVLDTSRRVVLPLLAHLDRIGATRRLPDDRRLVVDAEQPLSR